LSANELDWSSGPASVSQPLLERPLDEAVAELYARLRLPVYGYVFATTGCRHEAEDVTQEVFFRLYLELRRGGRIGNLRSWIFSVAHNLAMSAHSREARQRSAEALQFSGRLGADPEDLLLSAERDRKMAFALKRLSARERQCIELRAEGLRYREIAAVLQVSVPAVQSFLARAIEKLKEDA